MQVQRGELTLTLTTHTVTLATPVPVGKSFPIISIRYANNRMDSATTAVLTGEVDENFTQIEFRRARNDYDVTVSYEVICGDEFTVQSGVSYLSSTTSTVNIDEVDLSQTFVVTSVRQNGATYNINDSYFRVRLSLPDNTHLVMSRNSSDTSAYGIHSAWYIVTMEGATVEQFTGSISYSEYTTDVTVNAVDLSRTFLLHTWEINHNGAWPSSSVIAHFVDNATVRCRLNYIPSVTVTGFAISHPKINVISGLTTIAIDVSTAQEYAPVDADVSFAVINTATASSGGASYLPGIYCTTTLDSANINFQRAHTASDCELAWFAVEWKPVLVPTALRPDNAAVMPNEQNTFRWVKDASMVVTAYEIGWREAGGEWLGSGKIVNDVQYHLFSAGTFGKGKDYEWRVRHWDNEQVDPSDWVSAIFNTYNPVIQNPIPSPGSSVRVEIRDFGGRLKSPYDRDIQLTILIANNPDFTSPTTYTLPAAASGEEAIMEHAVQEGGTWYVRMTATDSESLQTVLEYSFFAGQFIQFIKLPDIDIEAQPATHVTVRVKGTTTEYTVVIDPAPSADRIVERLFYIPTGTLANCQAVAEAFLAKLGRRQLTVSGVIPLTVTLKIGQYVRVVVPSANINQDMILQRKLHRINEGEAATHVTLGDIKVSDQEMIARIVERLESQGM